MLVFLFFIFHLKQDISLILSLVGVSMSVLFNFSLTFSSYEHRRHTALQHNVIKSKAKRPERDPEKQALIDDDRNRVAKTDIVAEASTTANGNARLGAGNDEVVLRKPKKNFFKSPLLYQNALL